MKKTFISAILLAAATVATAQAQTYHSPKNDAQLGFELNYMYDALKVVENEETGNREFFFQDDFESWVSFGPDALKATNRNYADMDATTGEHVPVYWFSTEPYISTLRQYQYIPVVGATNSLHFYVKDCTKAKVFFNGSSSTPGTGKLTVTSTDGESLVLESTTPLGKKTEQKSDVIEATLDGSKSYDIKIEGTADLSVWALDLWASSTDGIEKVTAENVAGNDQMYNLAGQRVSNSYKGIAIVNGKKIMK